MKSIDPALDLGNGKKLSSYIAEVDNYKNMLSDYNTALSTVDNLYNKCIAQVSVLKDWNEKMLLGIADKYGKDSSEYEMAGGTRKSERKKPKLRAKKSA